MTKAIKFTLSGQNAFFKKPDVNTYLYFTYGQIHKVAILGLFGAIIGCNGYSQMNFSKKKKGELSEEFPEFYQAFKDIIISVAPKSENGYIDRKTQVFNNSVGYASKEPGGNLIVKEQWLENPSWDIYVLIDENNEYLLKLKDYILNRKSVYTPYLGKNDHFANITAIKEVELSQYCDLTKPIKISSLYPKEIGSIIVNYDSRQNFKYEENLPYALDSMLNKYMVKPFCFTNFDIECNDKALLYSNGKVVLAFY